MVRCKRSRLQSQIRFSKALLVVLFCVPIPAFAACHAVTPSGAGSKNGSNWSNAYAGIPASRMRGDLYYLADGSYGTVNLSDADSGTKTIELRKAQSYDFGRTSDGCSNDISSGWNSGTMGSSQAVFASGQNTVYFGSEYWIINGNGTSTGVGCGGAPGSTITSGPQTPSDCGIKIDNHSCSSGCSWPFSGTTAGHITTKYLEWYGDSTPSANEDGFSFWPNSNGNLTFNHIYAHNAGCVWIQDGVASSSVTYNYFWGTESAGALNDGCHGQFMFDAGSDSNSTINHNIFRDITGTAVLTFANSSTDHDSWTFYDNVVFNSSFSVSQPTSGLGHLSDGVIACINSGTQCTNFMYVQNTVVNEGGSSGINDENGNGSYTISNNLYYFDTLGAGWTGNANPSFTSFLLLQGSSCPSGGTSNVCDGKAPNPFNNYSAFDFSLASDNADWNNRNSLGAPYNVDIVGNTFTSDRGAYQYNGNLPPSPPSGLTATVQ